MLAASLRQPHAPSRVLIPPSCCSSGQQLRPAIMSALQKLGRPAQPEASSAVQGCSVVGLRCRRGPAVVSHARPGCRDGRAGGQQPPAAARPPTKPGAAPSVLLCLCGPRPPRPSSCSCCVLLPHQQRRQRAPHAAPGQAGSWRGPFLSSSLGRRTPLFFSGECAAAPARTAAREFAAHSLHFCRGPLPPQQSRALKPDIDDGPRRPASWPAL
jgi:hypothetical protein